MTIFVCGRSCNSTHLGPVVKVGGVLNLTSPSVCLLEFLTVFDT